jgi:hypothetical protein
MVKPQTQQLQQHPSHSHHRVNQQVDASIEKIAADG